MRAMTKAECGTYADTAAVNRGAMTAWRRQLLWQFYMATHNRLTGHVEDRRIHIDPEAPVLGKAPKADRAGLQNFLEGFPERYLRTHSVDQVLVQYKLSKELESKEASVSIEKKDSRYEIMVLTWDRPFLFASVCAGNSLRRPISCTPAACRAPIMQNEPNLNKSESCHDHKSLCGT